MSPAYKRGLRLFEAGIYTRKYGMCVAIGSGTKVLYMPALRYINTIIKFTFAVRILIYFVTV